MDFRKSFMVLFFIVAISMVHLGLYTRSINLKYEVEGQKRSLKALQDEIRQLNSACAERGDLKRIEDIAKSRLHMIRPADMNYIKVSTSEIAP